jgi:hypothetical protein
MNELTNQRDTVFTALATAEMLVYRLPASGKPSWLPHSI